MSCNLILILCGSDTLKSPHDTLHVYSLLMIFLSNHVIQCCSSSYFTSYNALIQTNLDIGGAPHVFQNLY
jgi:hypothetical protein